MRTNTISRCRNGSTISSSSERPRVLVMPDWDDSSTRSWDSIADDWVRHADTNDYRNDLLMPLMLELLADVRGSSILDLGCGEGGYSRELARRGAKVVGVDGSSRLIARARERAPDIEY